MELTIKEACTNPANFMYLWADEDAFLRYLKPQWASVIRGKKRNQMKLILLSAQKYLNKNAVLNGKEYHQYTDAIRQAFVDTYDMTPGNALLILAQGGTVAGKNWSEGVFGIGATNQFYGTNITVRPNDGYFEKGGVLLPGNEDLNVYANVGGKTVVYQRFYEDPESGVTYMSQLNKVTKKYYAASYSSTAGTFKAKNGDSINPSDSADIWGTILASLDKFLNWLISLFAGNSNTDLITAENTLPNQKGDGFVQTGGGGISDMLESGSGLLIAAAAAGLLLMGGSKKKK